MDNRVRICIAFLIPLFFAASGASGVLYLWKSIHAAPEVASRLPGEDQRPALIKPAQDTEPMVGRLVKFSGKASDLPGAWPRFRGAGFDAVSTEATPLADSWPEAGPGVLWSIEAGEGFAGAAIFEGCVYLMDYDRDSAEESIRCLSLDTGEEIWRYAYALKIKRWHGMSRTVPVVTEEYVLAMGAKCHVTCLSRKTGELLWTLDLVRDYGTTVPQWYTSQCPLIDNGKAIIAPGGHVPGHGCGLQNRQGPVGDPQSQSMGHDPQFTPAHDLRGQVVLCVLRRCHAIRGRGRHFC